MSYHELILAQGSSLPGRLCSWTIRGKYPGSACSIVQNIGRLSKLAVLHIVRLLATAFSHDRPTPDPAYLRACGPITLTAY